jgi:hypothetical protein
MRKLIYACGIICLFPLLGHTQSTPDEDVVVITTKAKRDIEPAIRITNAPKLIDTVVHYKAIEYPLLNLKYETSISLEPIVPANVKLSENTMQKLYKGYVRAGIGSTLMP